MSIVVVDVFLQCDQAIRRGRLIHRTSRADKEFHFQDWFQERLDELRVLYDPPARNSYPDFRLVNSPVGYEIKGLAYPVLPLLERPAATIIQEYMFGD